MQAVFLPGGSRVDVRAVPKPAPGPGQALLKMRASTICGSDVRAIYRQHLGQGPEAYQDVIAGHEPAGEIVAVGPGVDPARAGERCVVYHISGCGQCADCRAGYQISCAGPGRRAYGWQRDGGHSEYLLADARDLITLPEPLTFVDGACVACGFGTAYEALAQAEVSGRDDVVVTGMGPVGLALGLMARKLGAPKVVGLDVVAERRQRALELGAVTDVADSTDPAAGAAQVRAILGRPDASVCIDASGNPAAQKLALKLTARWGRCVLVGEGGEFSIDASPELIHRCVRLIGSWVTSTGRMAELVERLVRWDLHPEVVVSHRFSIGQAAEAYRLADAGVAGKVAIVQ
jgi:threonine dehydrogenase-like Zn-dependent dehydrogenase